MGIGNHNFDAQSHQQLYDKIHGGPGSSAAQAVDDAWNGFRAVMANAKAELEAAIRDAGAVWVGAAGEQFTGSAAPLVQWAEDARQAGVATHQSFQAQQSYYTGAVTRMPEPVQVSSTANDDWLGIPAGFTHLVGGQTDQDIQEQQANEAKREAVRVMDGYRDGASSAVAALGAFTPPPRVTTEVAEPHFEQPEAQRQYSQQFSDGQWSTTSATEQSRSTRQTTQQPTQQQVSTPPALTPVDQDTTDTSAVGPRPDLVPRPGPLPTPVPSPTPTPPPIGGPPIVGPMPPGLVPPKPMPPGRDRIGNQDSRVNGPGSGPAKGTGVGSPRGFGVAPRFGGLPGQPSLPGQPPLPGPTSGIGGGDVHTGRPGTTPGSAAAGVRGAAGAPGMGGIAGAPQRGQGEDDLEHKAAPYLEELEDVWGQDDIPRVAPPVIGDDQS
ncbi:hypothetical protein JOF41_000753 [Saccharothrix coeruleofusca]|uniref:PPE family protein n=1 Tax=Saccharothrix coeruleofusca TaxID=33919 RepID=UPI001AE75AF7|nr:PPE domain-containing protein [Saccharothrix coeruleofusca]MBP2334575.1 hypothetical protein [Saccharothrix coeruleofusca]